MKQGLWPEVAFLLVSKISAEQFKLARPTSVRSMRKPESAPTS